MRHDDIILIPVHNRRETTVGCLRFLRGDDVFSWAKVIVIDDGSTDGTSEAVCSEFPDVEILRGTGSWWWTGAIRRGMELALTQKADRVIWLNDDCMPPPASLWKLSQFVREKGGVAWITARAPGGWDYGGHVKTVTRIRRCTPAEESRGRIDTFSGNCVCIPRDWIEKIGLPDDHHFPHGIGDLDYGLRLRAAGASLRALPDTIATNADPSQSSSESWLRSARPMRAIWNDFRSPKSFLNFRAWRHFAIRHWGPIWGPVVYVLPYIRWALIATVRSLRAN